MLELEFLPSLSPNWPRRSERKPAFNENDLSILKLPCTTPAPSHTLYSRVVRPKSSNEAKTLLKSVPLPLALRPSRKSGQLRNRTNDPSPTRLMLSCNRVTDPPNRKVWGPRTTLRSSLAMKLFCVMVRGKPEAILTEPRICKLGSSLLLLISPSATPTSDHLNGVMAPVLVCVRT